jgi:purine-nucleoside phosphorylase
VRDMTDDPFAVAAEAGTAIRERFGIAGLDSAFVLGSGWSAAADDLGELVGSCELAELPGFAAPTVLGHGGSLRVVRTPTRTTVAVLTGRTHFYETRDVVQVVHGVRAMAAAGAKVMVLTNGCGSLNTNWGAGTVVLIADHINLTGASPLRGATFVDLSEAYAGRLRTLARGVDASLPEGVYVQFGGPQFETPAEVRMAGVLGGDLVGMSTTLETIAAREAGLEVLGISLVTNLAAGISPEPLNHQEVLQAGRQAAPRLRQLLAGIAAAL